MYKKKKNQGFALKKNHLYSLNAYNKAKSEMDTKCIYTNDLVGVLKTMFFDQDIAHGLSEKKKKKRKRRISPSSMKSYPINLSQS